MKTRYIATLLGCAIGDTLGMPVETWTPEQIKKYVGRVTEPIAPFYVRDNVSGKILHGDEFGSLGYWGRDFKLGEYTDDTILTLALAESIAESGALDLGDAARRQLTEYVARLQPDGKAKGGFGGTTVAAFQNLLAGVSPLDSGVIGSPGNAPPMKMSPVGLYMHATGRYEEGLEFALKVGRNTHLDPRSIAGGVVQAHAVYAVLTGASRQGFVDSLVKVCEKYEQPADSRFKLHDAGTLVSRLDWVRKNMDASCNDAYRHLGTDGIVWESFPLALFMFQKHWDSSLEGLIATVNYGGDCDTTGAMYGAIAGAKDGMFFPKEWLDILQGRDRLAAAAEKIYLLGVGR